MPRGGLDRIREALGRLPTASRAELREDWLQLYRNEPPTRLGRDLLMAAIAYGLQEQVLGGLRPQLRRRLRKIAQQVRQGREPTIPAAPPLKPGTSHPPD